MKISSRGIFAGVVWSIASVQDSTAFSASLTVAPHRWTVLQSSTSGDDFSSFAASLETPTPSPRTRNNNNNKPRTWKDDLDELLDPATEMNRRQALFTDVVSANQDIRDAVETALRDRKVSAPDTRIVVRYNVLTVTHSQDTLPLPILFATRD
jgi:hypothetical protein